MIEQARRSRDLIVRELEILGASDIRVVRRTKHYAVEFRVGPKCGFVTFTGTKTCFRGVRNQIAVARRLFRNLS